MMNDILSLIHKINPYENFDSTGFSFKDFGCGGDEDIFSILVERTKPEIIIEVGTWLGQSALTMAKKLKVLQLNSVIICVDTWLGALEFLDNQEDKDRYLGLNLKNGYPSVYYQFLYNVIHENLQNYIIPFPQTSLLAAKLLHKFGVRSDLIYIDGSHEHEDVLSDLKLYSQILSPKGQIFGHDFSMVSNAIKEFTELNKNCGFDNTIFGKEFWILTRK